MKQIDRRLLISQLSPTTIFLLVFFVAPMAILVLYSLWRVESFQFIKEISLINYITALKDELFMNVLLRSIMIGLMVSLSGIIISYPMAYIIVFRMTRLRDLIIFLIVLSLLSSYLVKVYAWRTILGNQGIINTFLSYLGIISEPLEILLFTKFSVYIALVNILLPFILIPLYSTLLNIDPELFEASRDLGANPFTTFIKVTLPLSIPGIRTAFIFSFVIASGDYVIPEMLGGPSGLMVGRVIANHFGGVFNWAKGSADVFILMAFDLVVFAAFSFILAKLFIRRRKVQIEKR